MREGRWRYRAKGSRCALHARFFWPDVAKEEGITNKVPYVWELERMLRLTDMCTCSGNRRDKVCMHVLWVVYAYDVMYWLLSTINRLLLPARRKLSKWMIITSTVWGTSAFVFITVLLALLFCCCCCCLLLLLVLLLLMFFFCCYLPHAYSEQGMEFSLRTLPPKEIQNQLQSLKEPVITYCYYGMSLDQKPLLSFIKEVCRGVRCSVMVYVVLCGGVWCMCVPVVLRKVFCIFVLCIVVCCTNCHSRYIPMCDGIKLSLIALKPVSHPFHPFIVAPVGTDKVHKNCMWKWRVCINILQRFVFIFFVVYYCCHCFFFFNRSFFCYHILFCSLF